MVGGEFESLVILILQMWLYRPNPSHFKSHRFPFQTFHLRHHQQRHFSGAAFAGLVLAQFIRLFLGNFIRLFL